MTKKEIKDDLLEQLEAQGKYQNYYLDLIEDYMKYYDLKRKCQRDIKEKWRKIWKKILYYRMKKNS